MISRRGLLGALLAAPVIIKTPGLLMPVKAPSFSTRDFSTHDLIVTVRERHLAGWADRRAMWSTLPGDVGAGLDPIEAARRFNLGDVPLAVERMKDLRRMELEIAMQFQPHQRVA